MATGESTLQNTRDVLDEEVRDPRNRLNARHTGFHHALKEVKRTR